MKGQICLLAQPIRLKRQLKVYSEKGDLILETEFTEIENSFKLDIGNDESIRIVVSSLDKIVVEESISVVEE